MIWQDNLDYSGVVRYYLIPFLNLNEIKILKTFQNKNKTILKKCN